MPVTAATREVLQGHFGAAQLQKNPEEYLAKDFAALAETMALAAGMKLTPENKNVADGAGVNSSSSGEDASAISGSIRRAIDGSPAMGITSRFAGHGGR